MKILFIARGIPHKKDPQEGCFEFDQAKALASLGHNVTIMAIDSRFRKYWRKPGIEKRIIDGIKTYKLFLFPTSVIRRLISYRTGYYLESFMARYLYNRIIKEQGDFDIVHAHYLTCIYYGVIIKKRYNIRLIGTEHWSKVSSETDTPLIRFLAEESYHNLDKLLTVSAELGKKIKTAFNIESSVIHNLIDTSLLSPVRTDCNKCYTITAVGSLIHLKGFDILIKAFAKSGLYRDGAILKIVGGGHEYSALQKIITDNNLSEHVSLTGQLSKCDVFTLLHNADLYVLSSRQENFSVAILEAAANGLPSIATLCGGVAELTLNSVTKIPVEDIDAMADAMIECYNNRNNIDRKSIQSECLQLYSAEAIGKKLETIYNSVI